jgi:hypothetical protein
MSEDEPDFCLKANEAKFMDNYYAFLGILDLLSETCIGRNEKA